LHCNAELDVLYFKVPTVFTSSGGPYKNAVPAEKRLWSSMHTSKSEVLMPLYCRLVKYHYELEYHRQQQASIQ
jgi:hypothetical protein